LPRARRSEPPFRIQLEAAGGHVDPVPAGADRAVDLSRSWTVARVTLLAYLTRLDSWNTRISRGVTGASCEEPSRSPIGHRDNSPRGNARSCLMTV